MYSRRRTHGGNRQRIAEVAARLMAEDGIDNYAVAKRKAAQRLGVKVGKHLPDNMEIEAVLSQYQRLFQGESQCARVRSMRETALSAMRTLAAFTPRLVGSVLAGTASEHSVIVLHLFAESSESVALALNDRSIPFEHADKRLRFNVREFEVHPSFRFIAGQHALELVVFPLKDLRRAPLSPSDGKPMRRADQAAVEQLINE